MTDNPTITLSGASYQIPPLTIKQLREVDWRIIRSGNALFDRAKFTQEVRDDFFEIVYTALTLLQPELTREKFEALNISLVEIMAAMPMIIKQTGLFKPGVEAAPTSGEAQSTGTS